MVWSLPRRSRGVTRLLPRDAAVSSLTQQALPGSKKQDQHFYQSPNLYTCNRFSTPAKTRFDAWTVSVATNFTSTVPTPGHPAVPTPPHITGRKVGGGGRLRARTYISLSSSKTQTSSSILQLSIAQQLQWPTDTAHVMTSRVTRQLVGIKVQIPPYQTLQVHTAVSAVGKSMKKTPTSTRI